MKAVICDEKGCGKVIDGEQTREFTKGRDGWELQITLTDGADRCAECSRRMLARAARASWDELKQVRKSKGETK